MTDLAIDALTSNPNTKVVLAIPSVSKGEEISQSVIAFTRGEFQFNLGNEFNQPSVNAAQQGLSGAVNGIKNALNSLFNTQFIQERIQHPGQTINSWIGSRRPVFNVPLVFVAIRPGDDVRESIKILSRAVTPTIVGTGLGQRYRAPLSYSVDLASATALGGTITMEIGRWFRATGLVMKDMSSNISNIPTPSGLPLMAEATVTLEPFKAVTFRDIEGYFRNTTATI